MKNSSGNIIVSHYDWFAAGLGILVFMAALGVLFLSFGESPDEGATAYARRLDAMKPSGTGVTTDDMQHFQLAMRLAKTPPALAEIDPKHASFLASARRVVCTNGDPASKKAACGRPIAADATVCPFCGVQQPAVEKVLVDSDNDGLPNDYEIAHGLNPNDPSDAAKDSDGDGFTNLEEFKAGTDPKDAMAHPDYLDSLAVDGALKQTFLPFIFQAANPIPGGHRFTFREPHARIPGSNQRGRNHTPKLGEEIGSTGFVVTNYVHRTEERRIKGGGSATRPVDVSTVTIMRKSDGRSLTIRLGQKDIPVDMQANLVYSRGGGQHFTVMQGSSLTLSGKAYRVAAIRSMGKGCEVVVEEVSTGKQKTIQGLD